MLWGGLHVAQQGQGEGEGGGKFRVSFWHLIWEVSDLVQFFGRGCAEHRTLSFKSELWDAHPVRR